MTPFIETNIIVVVIRVVGVDVVLIVVVLNGFKIASEIQQSSTVTSDS